MLLFIVLGVIVLIAFIVLGVLFYMLDKEAQKRQEVVPVMPPAQEELYRKRARDLEDELRSISQKAQQQSGEAKQLIENLTRENELLKSQKPDFEQAQKKLVDLETESSTLKTENAGLQNQLETTGAKVKFLEEEIAAVKMQMGEEISRANATVAELTKEKENLASDPAPDPDEALRAEVESLRSEKAALGQKCEDLERTYQKLQELNDSLAQKNEAMQYELIKARAQSSGLERVSFNYKNQLEDFLKKVSEAETANERLAQVKNRLEGMVEEIKLENEDLVKKDQLAQFELEKNRSRLVNLEREYEELKVRVQQKEQP